MRRSLFALIGNLGLSGRLMMVVMRMMIMAVIFVMRFLLGMDRKARIQFMRSSLFVLIRNFLRTEWSVDQSNDILGKFVVCVNM